MKTVPDVDDSRAPSAFESSIDSTLDAMQRIHQRRATLLAHKLAAEDQLLHRVGREFAAGGISLPELVEIYYRYRDIAEPGFSNRWNENVPITAGSIRSTIRWGNPNTTSDGSWFGVAMLSQNDAAPGRGQAVVYVLYDDDGRACYVGSSGHFRTRLKAHRKAKTFSTWRAWACDNREDAYRREDKMLREVKPYLNRKASR